MTSERSRHELPSLGPRGEGWVALQVVLLLLLPLAAAVGPRWPDAWDRALLATGAVVGLAGAFLFLAGVLRLGAQLTPFPKPVEGGVMHDGGVFGLVRHPIYGGVLLLALAWSLATSPLCLVPSALLVLVFAAKSRREESWLVDHHPGYQDYRRRVPRRFIPFLW
jgi:protein-S-isoprenylcysteine O-methyltransferase Ste14